MPGRFVRVPAGNADCSSVSFAEDMLHCEPACTNVTEISVGAGTHRLRGSDGLAMALRTPTGVAVIVAELVLDALDLCKISRTDYANLRN